MYDYRCVIHVHTDNSPDSLASFQDVARGAAWGKADVVVVTDHDSLALKPLEGWIEAHGHKFLLLVGEEVTTASGGHYLALGINRPIKRGLPAQRVIEEVAGQGGVGFIEHPFFKGNPWFKAPPTPWSDWEVYGFTGLSVFNFTSDWGSRITPPEFFIYGIWPGLAVDRPNPRTLNKWDELAADRRAVGIGTVDAHLFMARLGGRAFEVHPFRYFFHSIRTHILTDHPLHRLDGDLEHDRDLFLKALKSGSCFISNDYLGEGEGFLFEALDETGQSVARMGESVTVSPGATLLVRCPEIRRTGSTADRKESVILRVTIRHNGRVKCVGLYTGDHESGRWVVNERGRISPATGVARLSGGRRQAVSAKSVFDGAPTLTYNAKEAGAYRTEVEMKIHGRFKPWIYSNHIYLKRTPR